MGTYNIIEAALSRAKQGQGNQSCPYSGRKRCTEPQLDQRGENGVMIRISSGKKLATIGLKKSHRLNSEVENICINDDH